MLSSDIPFDPRHTEEDVTAGLNFLRDYKYPNTGYFNAVFARVDKGKTATVEAACHGQQQMGNYYDAKLIATLNHRPYNCNTEFQLYGATCKAPEGYSKEAHDAFMLFWFTESWMARWVLNPDKQSIIDCGVLISTDIPASVMGIMLVVSRNPREFHRQVRFWHHMYTSGWDPYLAYVVAFNVKRYASTVALKSFDFGAEVNVYPTGTGHSVFDVCPNKTMVKNFIRGEITDKKAGQKWTNSPYSGFKQLFDPGFSTYDVVTPFFKDVTDVIDGLGKTEVVEKLPCPFGDYKKVSTQSVLMYSRESFDRHVKSVMEDMFL